MLPVIQNNLGIEAAGFLYAEDSIIDVQNYNIINNTAQMGGVMYIENTLMTLVGSMDLTMPTLYENNEAILGGVVYGSNSTIITTHGYFLFRNNVAVRTNFFNTLHIYVVVKEISVSCVLNS